MGFDIKPISRSEMEKRVSALDEAYLAEQREAWRNRVSCPRIFSMSDLVAMTGRAQEHLIGLEAAGKIPKAIRLGKKRFYSWLEKDARMVIAIVQALPRRGKAKR